MSLDISGFAKVTAFSSLETLQEKVTLGLNYFVAASALVAVIMIIIAGYTFITASGDPDRIQKAGQTITAAVVGLIIVFVARLIVEFVVARITS